MITHIQARREAKRIKREYGCKLCHAFEIVAVQHGWANWNEAYAAIVASDNSPYLQHRLEVKAATKECRRVRKAEDRKERLKAANAKADAEGHGPGAVRQMKSSLAILRPTDRPIDATTVQVVFKPYSDSP